MARNASSHLPPEAFLLGEYDPPCRAWTRICPGPAGTADGMRKVGVATARRLGKAAAGRRVHRDDFPPWRGSRVVLAGRRARSYLLDAGRLTRRDGGHFLRGAQVHGGSPPRDFSIHTARPLHPAS